LDISLKHEVATVRSKAASALPVFLSEYYQHGENVLDGQKAVIDSYLSNLEANSETTRMGFSLAIGKFISRIFKRTQGTRIFVIAFSIFGSLQALFLPSCSMEE